MALVLRNDITNGGNPASSNGPRSKAISSNNRIGSLLSTTSRVEAPFIRVKLGDYTFGVYEEKQTGIGNNGLYKNISTKYPNFVQSLQIKKINGTVNQYTLNISYPVAYENDPNFFEKIFSSISQTRLINIDYGDFSLPEYIYRDEEAIITNVTTSFDMRSSVINYTIEATSTASLTLSGCYSFGNVSAKPSDEIKRVLYNTEYHLTDVFVGMKDRALVEQQGLIASDDKIVHIPTCTNMSVLDYIALLVSYMTPAGSPGTNGKKSNVYSLTTYEDTTGVYGGPYFKVQKIQSSTNVLNKLCTYEIDIGYPTSNIVTSFSLKNNSQWSIYYDYNHSLSSSDYIKRINDKGELEYEYSPLITGVKYDLNEADKSWWTKVTEFPIQATIDIRGLLKPAILMNYVKLNVWFHGHKHVSSGYYIITSQVDTVDAGGYRTKLELTRVAPDESNPEAYTKGNVTSSGSSKYWDPTHVEGGNSSNTSGASLDSIKDAGKYVKKDKSDVGKAKSGGKSVKDLGGGN